MESGSYETLLLEKEEGQLWITLNRPHRLNALNDVMLRELSDAMDKAEEDEEVRCVVLTGAGDRAFCAGVDLTMLARVRSPSEARAWSLMGQEVFTKIEHMSKPVIAAINGYCLGGGFELALSCDFRIAAEHAEFGYPEIKIGLIPLWGGNHRLLRFVGLTKAKELIMLGDRISAEEALKLGIVNKVVPYEKLHEEARALARRLVEGPPIALKYAKQVLNLWPMLEVGSNMEVSVAELLARTEDVREGIEAFLSKRKPEFKGR